MSQGKSYNVRACMIVAIIAAIYKTSLNAYKFNHFQSRIKYVETLQSSHYDCAIMCMAAKVSTMYLKSTDNLRSHLTVNYFESAFTSSYNLVDEMVKICQHLKR
jgi:hypothetical protein